MTLEEYDLLMKLVNYLRPRMFPVIEHISFDILALEFRVPDGRIRFNAGRDLNGMPHVNISIHDQERGDLSDAWFEFFYYTGISTEITKYDYGTVTKAYLIPMDKVRSIIKQS